GKCAGDVFGAAGRVADEPGPEPHLESVPSAVIHARVDAAVAQLGIAGPVDRPVVVRHRTGHANAEVMLAIEKLRSVDLAAPEIEGPDHRRGLGKGLRPRPLADNVDHAARIRLRTVQYAVWSLHHLDALDQRVVESARAGEE